MPRQTSGRRSRGGLLAPVLALMVGGAGLGESRQAPAATARVVVAEYDGIIHPVADEFFGEVL